MKNTYLVLKTYIDYPDLGELTIICRSLCLEQGIFNYNQQGVLNVAEYNDFKKLLEQVKNDVELNKRIRIVKFYEEILELDGKSDLVKGKTQQEQMKISSDYIFNTYGLHLCPSESEGFGHYMHEASCNNIVIITDFSPFNEYVINEFNGFIVPTYFGNPDNVGVMGRFGIKKQNLKQMI